MNEYTDWDRASQHPINTRDTAVAALSDAQYVAPLMRTADVFAVNAPVVLGTTISSGGGGGSGGGGAGNGNVGSSGVTNGGSVSGNVGGGSHHYSGQSGHCYFYVFDYQTKDGDYPQRMGTVHGEDLPYVFGAPLVDGFSHFPQNYTKSEIALSEAVITYWTNFARTGYVYVNIYIQSYIMSTYSLLVYVRIILYTYPSIWFYCNLTGIPMNIIDRTLFCPHLKNEIAFVVLPGIFTIHCIRNIWKLVRKYSVSFKKSKGFQLVCSQSSK